MEQSRKDGQKKTVIIIGAGPAGLTAAHEFLKNTDVHPVILEASPTYVGGISKTVVYKGNRIDIGGHRFFSKSDTVMDWWLNILPLEKKGDAHIAYQGKERVVGSAATPARDSDDVMLLRGRLTRIYYNKRFFAYPVTLSVDTLRKLGLLKVIKIGVTYIYRMVFPRRPEVTLEDFFVNRFGDELYKTFFKSYTEKVWGKECRELSADWGAQRVKGLSVMKAVFNALAKPFRAKDIKQKSTETSLIEQFLYPKHGPGHLWEVVARNIKKDGGEIHMGIRVTKLLMENGTVRGVLARDAAGVEREFAADYVISTMPINELVTALDTPVPQDVRTISSALEYRDFVTVGVLVRKHDLEACIGTLNDTWIYVHEPKVLMGRIQVFNNWSPYLVADDTFIWLGLEYFCTEGDAFWKKSDDELKALAAEELQTIGFVKSDQVADAVVLREKKTYPVYAGAYENFPVVQQYLDSIPNLFPVGRNGMHRYNNQDHSMLTAMGAVELIKEGKTDKRALWEINTEKDYHEEKSELPKKTRISAFLEQFNVEKIFLCLFVAVTLLVALFVTKLDFRNTPLPMYGQDSHEFIGLAKHIFQDKQYTQSIGEPIVLEGYRPPGYPIFLAVLFPFHDFLFGVSLVQLFLYALTIIFMYRLTARFVSPRVGFVTAILLILNVSALFFSMVILSDMLLVFLVIASLYWFLLYDHANVKTKRYMLYAGLALGGATLTRPIAEFLPLLFVPMYYVYHMRIRMVRAVRPLIYFLVGFVLVVTPWLVRNHAHFGVATISTVGSYNLLLHNVALYHAHTNDISLDEARRQVVPASLGNYDEINFSSPDHVKTYSETARAYILNDPFGYGAFHLKKTIPFFFGDSFEGLYDPGHAHVDAAREINISSLIMQGKFEVIYSTFKNGLKAGEWSYISFVLNLVLWFTIYLIVLGALGVALIKKTYHEAPQAFFFLTVAVLLIGYFAILTGPVSMPRYRLPAEPFIFVLVAYGLVSFYDCVRKWKEKKNLVTS